LLRRFLARLLNKEAKMFSELKAFGYSFIKTGTPRSEIKKAKRERYLDIKHQKQGLPFNVKCDNSSCFSVIEYIYQNNESEREVLSNAGWRRFNATMVLCPRCREIQEKRIMQEHKNVLREINSKLIKLQRQRRRVKIKLEHGD
jgi:phage FluMu protein Com